MSKENREVADQADSGQFPEQRPRDVLDDIDEIAKSITGDEIEQSLHKTLLEAGYIHSSEAEADLCLSSLFGGDEIQAARQEARHILAQAREEARQIRAEAQAAHDAALDQAAQIVGDARRQAAQMLDDARRSRDKEAPPRTPATTSALSRALRRVASNADIKQQVRADSERQLRDIEELIQKLAVITKEPAPPETSRGRPVRRTVVHSEDDDVSLGRRVRV